MIPCTRMLRVPSFLKERTMISRQQKLIRLPLVGTIFLCVLACLSLTALVGFARFLSRSVAAPPVTISKRPVETSPNAVVKHWTGPSMPGATDAGLLIRQASDLTQGSSDTSLGKAA